VDIGTVYDTLMERNGAFRALGIDRMLVGAGTWTHAFEPGLISRARFDHLKLVSSDKAAKNGILFNGDPLPVNSEAFKTEFGSRRARSRSSKASRAAKGQRSSNQGKDAGAEKSSPVSNQKESISEEEKAAKRLRSASISPEEKADKRRRKELRNAKNEGK
jgi:hypothetical protein